MQTNIAKNIKRLEKVSNLMIKRFFITLGWGLGANVIINIIGFMLGTVVYSKEGFLHNKIDIFAQNLAAGTFKVFALVSIVFVVRFVIYKSQSTILKSIQ